MHLLQSGTDLAVIALWLGHSSPAVTHQYLEADLAAKEAVLRRLTDPSPQPARFQPGDRPDRLGRPGLQVGKAEPPRTLRRVAEGEADVGAHRLAKVSQEGGLASDSG